MTEPIYLERHGAIATVVLNLVAPDDRVAEGAVATREAQVTRCPPAGRRVLETGG